MPVTRALVAPPDPAAGHGALLADALDGSDCLGFWIHDLPSDRLAVAASLGQALGLAPEEGAGVPLARVLSGIHAEDRLRIESVLRDSWESGVPFETEFRTRTGGRALRLMGCAALDPGRRTVRARGLAFDLTRGRLGRGSPDRQAQRRVNRLADHVLAMRALVVDLGNPPLARLIDEVAKAIGFELARHLRKAQGERRH